jgi:ribosomal protein S6
MPFYQQLIVTMPKFPKEALVALFKRHSKLVIEHGGVVRGIEHHGIRPLPERATRYNNLYIIILLWRIIHNLFILILF